MKMVSFRSVSICPLVWLSARTKMCWRSWSTTRFRIKPRRGMCWAGMIPIGIRRMALPQRLSLYQRQAPYDVASSSWWMAAGSTSFRQFFPVWSQHCPIFYGMARTFIGSIGRLWIGRTVWVRSLFDLPGTTPMDPSQSPHQIQAFFMLRIPREDDFIKLPGVHSPIGEGAVEETKEQTSGVLPKTATDQFNYMLLGILLVALGITLLVIARRKREFA